MGIIRSKLAGWPVGPVVLLTLWVWMGWACAPRPSEEALRDRVQKEWEAKVKGDWGTVYDMCSSNFKEHSERARFVSGSNLRVDAFEIEKITLDDQASPARATVTVKASMKPMGFELKGVRITEKWIFEDGEWRLDIDPKRNPITG